MSSSSTTTPTHARELAARYLSAVRALAEFDERTEREMITADLLLDEPERRKLGRQHDARMNRLMGRLCRAERRLARLILSATGWQAPGRERVCPEVWPSAAATIDGTLFVVTFEDFGDKPVSTMAVRHVPAAAAPVL